MKDQAKVGIAQISSVLMNKEETIEKACRYIEEAGRKKIDILVFPETYIPCYPYWRGISPVSKWSDLMVEYHNNSLLIPGKGTDILCESVKDANLICVMGCSEVANLTGSETLYNTLLFIDRNGKILGKHRKLMPTHAERMIWGNGDGRDIRVFDTEVGCLGGLICYENHMTLSKYALAAKGEEIHCAVWPGWWVMERHPGNKKKFRSGMDQHRCDIEHAIREYAFETQTFVISASGLAIEGEIPDEWNFEQASGGSFIVNPAGEIIKGPIFEKECIICADINFRDRLLTKAYFDALGHYSRWDILNLNISDTGRGYAPIVGECELPSLNMEISDKIIDDLSKKYEIDRKKVEDILGEVVDVLLNAEDVKTKL